MSRFNAKLQGFFVSDEEWAPYQKAEDYSKLTFGESLSKITRPEFTIICLEGIQDELDHKPIPNKSRGRGRPTSPVGILAQRMEVHPDSVRRWTDLREVQASDHNATRLAEMAFKYRPQKLAKILRADIDRRRMAMDIWLKDVDANKPVSPYVENKNDKNQRCMQAGRR